MTPKAQHKLSLLKMKQMLLNQMSFLKAEFNLVDKSKGDESDQSVAHQEEHSFLITQSRYKFQLMEIDYALSRIENGSYGICEETLEPIEDVRLKAIPWTRYSIEGAEIREATLKKADRRKMCAI
ncbi:MAG: TraR/DksA family transcriptional regulator [Moraxellaceae bacterium]|nr:TraR/DksA family transcriptional regulator [Pseudobdellovibrionaceae bacterium]